MQSSQLLALAHEQYLQKLGIYLSRLTTQSDIASKKKIISLAGFYILRQRDDSQFIEKSYKKIKEFIQKTSNYYGLELLDYMIKNSKTFMSLSHTDLENLFITVYGEVKVKKNHQNLNNMKLIWKTWTYIVQNKYIKNIRTKISSNYSDDLQDIPQNLIEDVKKFISQIEPQTKNALDSILLESDSN